MSRSSADPAAEMLAEYMAGVPFTTGVQFNSGSARVAAAAIEGAQAAVDTDRTLWCAERYFPAFDAVRRIAARVANTRVDTSIDAGSRVHAFHAHGARAFPAGLSADVLTLRIPTEKLATQLLIWDAFHVLREGGVCLLAGGTNEGVKPAVRMLDTLFGESLVEQQHSGHRLVRATKHRATPESVDGFDSPYLAPDAFRHLRVNARNHEWLLYTRPGVFSWEHIDEATALLAEAMEVRTGESVLDIGSGAGLLGMIAARLSGTGPVMMVEADSESVRCAEKSIEAAAITNAEVLASDVTSAVGERTFDVVLSNPPFHQGKAVDLVLPRRFIGEAWNHLISGGRLYIVANRTLPYERVIAEQFGNVRVLHDGARFKVLGAAR